MATTAVKHAQKTWDSHADFEVCTRDVGIDNARPGVRLAKSVMLQDERGRTHINNVERLSDRVWARKDFMLQAGDVADAKLYFYSRANRDDTNSKPTQVSLNGRRLKPVRKLPSTGWSVVTVPAKALQPGLNSFVFSGGGKLVVEDSVYPNRSAKSVDGGATWDYDALGIQGMNDGEYLVRLRLERYPSEAKLTSEVVDFAALAVENGIFPRVSSVKVHFKADVDKPKGTLLRFEARTSQNGEDWSPWQAMSEVTGRERLPRYFQWRAVLRCKSGDATPTLRGVALKADVRAARTAATEAVRVVDMTPVNLAVSSYRFAYQEPFDRLERLRKQYDLKKVTAGHKTELGKLVALRNWCRHTAPKGWDSGRTQWCPPWDALILLETNQAPLALCMCTHYSTLFVQTAVALGYTARHVILDHHCVAEVWSNEFGKWILMDTGNSHDPSYNCHFECNGVPLSALEIRQLWKAKRTSEVQVVYAERKSIALDRIDANKHGWADLKLYRRFCIALRNNHLLTPFPGELTHGHGEYFCDVYLWWEDSAIPVESPEYGLTSNRPADYYWPVNETAIELTTGKDAGTLIVDLKTMTPNFDRFVVRIDRKKWQEKGPGFVWKLRPGRNVIEAKTVNTFRVHGPVSRAVVEMTK